MLRFWLLSLKRPQLLFHVLEYILLITPVPIHLVTVRLPHIELMHQPPSLTSCLLSLDVYFFFTKQR